MFAIWIDLYLCFVLTIGSLCSVFRSYVVHAAVDVVFDDFVVLALASNRDGYSLVFSFYLHGFFSLLNRVGMKLC